MTEIYLTISFSTHNGDDTPQNYEPLLFAYRMPLLRMTGAFTETLQWVVNVARLREIA